jgi:hypothetical protein
MARSFNGTSQYLKSASALTALGSATRIAIAFWINTTFASDDDILLETSANSNSNVGAFKVIGDESSSGRFWVDFLGNIGKTSGKVVPPSNSAWHHVLINMVSNSTQVLESVYIDGTSQSLTLGSAFSNTGTFSSQVLYVMSRGGTALFADGSMADLCIWIPDTALGSTEASALAAGRRAGTQRTSEVAYWWPLVGTTSPEPADTGGIDLTVSGATQTTDPPALDAYTPSGESANGTVTAVVATFSIAALEPSVSGDTVVVGGGPATTTFTALAPTVSGTTGSSDASVAATVATVSLTSNTPTVSAAGNVIVGASVATASLAAHAPITTVSVSVNATVASVILTAHIPTIVAGTGASVAALAASVALTSIAPTVAVLGPYVPPESDGIPSVVLDGVETQGVWSIMLQGVEVPVSSFTIMQEGIEVPLV